MKTKKRLYSFALGLFFAFVILEISLRLLPLFFSEYRGPLAPDRKLNREVILCLGNSFTLGIGAPRGEAYPDHLQRRLGTEKYQVINLGDANLNTTGQYFVFADAISKYRPKIILLQTGQPNWWNHFGFAAYLNRGPYFDFFLKYFHVFRLVDSLYHQHIKKRANPMEEFYLRNNRPTSAWVLDVLKRVDGFYNEPSKISSHLSEIESLTKDPRLEHSVYAALGNLYFNYIDKGRGLSLWMEAIEKDSEWDSHPFDSGYDFIQKVYPTLDEHLKAKVDVFSSSLAKKNKIKYERLKLTKSDVASWMITDLKKMASLAKENKTLLILQTYPPLDHQQVVRTAETNPILRQFAAQEGVWLIDHEKHFYEYFARNKIDQTKPEYYDGYHLSSKGYKLMSDFIYDYLIELNAVSSNTRND